jgi:hypothetical protein
MYKQANKGVITYPPVLVPPIMSNNCHGSLGRKPRCLRSAFTFAIRFSKIIIEESPRTPPPSNMTSELRVLPPGEFGQSYQVRVASMDVADQAQVPGLICATLVALACYLDPTRKSTFWKWKQVLGFESGLICLRFVILNTMETGLLS